MYSFGEGIEYVLEEISISPIDRQTFKADAQIIENAIIEVASRHDESFKEAFRGLSLGGSNLDDIKIDLPDEFDMHVKTNLPFKVTPVVVPLHPGYVFLRVPYEDRHHPCVELWDDGAYINRKKVQSWYRNNLTAIMPKLQNVICEDGRSYSLKYSSRGYSVAHTVVATERRNRGRRISFDFVPVFEFDYNEWPMKFQNRSPEDRFWFAIPRPYFSENAVDDSRSFFMCAPHWERRILENKQNLKDSLRLMKAFRNANEMWQLKSYMIKSLYLTKNRKKLIKWQTAPGILLIQMLEVLHSKLECKTLPFFWAPEHNLFETISDANISEYKKIVLQTMMELKKCRDGKKLSSEDLEKWFGI